jgi:hypothetical protein
MSRPWHKADPGLLEKMKADVQAVYPNLHFHPGGDRVVVRGTFPIVHEGELLDRYLVEIELPSDYPNAIPVVREVGSRIPRSEDYHINRTGEACLFIPDERWLVYPPGTSFLEFLNGPVRNFFLGQSLFALTNMWPFGQRRHGADGIHEYYAQLLGTDELTLILGYLECLSRPVLKGHWECPCRSGERLRDCHRVQIEDLRTKISPAVAARSRESLRTRKEGRA